MNLSCKWCGKPNSNGILCIRCLRIHDAILKGVVGVVFILAIISFIYYYKLFIA
ncbi:MAG: hypothetical protein ACOX0E_02165 [Syntrophomonadaceae bacterium]|jgi:hypothetical protein